MIRRTAWYLGMAILIAFACSGSGGGDGTPNEPDVVIDDGWDKFESADFAGAREIFLDLTESEGSAAYEGIGWCELMLDDAGDANSWFAQARDRVDANAGEALASWVLEDYAGVEDLLAMVVGKDPGWEFAHDSTINIDDLYLHAAYSHFHLGNLSRSVERIQNIEPGYQVDLDDPDVEQILLDKLAAMGAG